MAIIVFPLHDSFNKINIYFLLRVIFCFESQTHQKGSYLNFWVFYLKNIFAFVWQPCVRALVLLQKTSYCNYLDLNRRSNMSVSVDFRYDLAIFYPLFIITLFKFLHEVYNIFIDFKYLFIRVEI